MRVEVAESLLAVSMSCLPVVEIISLAKEAESLKCTGGV